MCAVPCCPELVGRGGGSRDETPKEKAGAFTSGCAGGKYIGPGDGDPSPMHASATSSLLKYCRGAPAPTADTAKVNAGSDGNLALYCLPKEELPLVRLRGGAKAILCDAQDSMEEDDKKSVLCCVSLQRCVWPYYCRPWSDPGGGGGHRPAPAGGSIWKHILRGRVARKPGNGGGPGGPHGPPGSGRTLSRPAAASPRTWLLSGSFGNLPHLCWTRLRWARGM
jgi:hypothetical protein